MAEPVELKFTATEKKGEVTALWWRPAKARCALVFGHGAGAGMRHAFMEAAAAGLARRGIATFRYHFPYMEAGRRSPDGEGVRLETVRSAVAAGVKKARGLPVFAGGKSMGGRMTSLAASQEPLEGISGIFFFGFPLHAPKKPASGRGDHLADVDVPLLFLQGTRDSLADLTLLRPITKKLGKRAAMHVVDDADHGFHVPKRSGRTDDEVLEELLDRVASWADAILES